MGGVENTAGAIVAQSNGPVVAQWLIKWLMMWLIIWQ
jgi:hypothetical protein